MENRVIKDYDELKVWFSTKDFTLDSNLSIENNEKTILKISTIRYSSEKDTDVIRVFPIELISALVSLNDKKIDLFEEKSTIKDIAVINTEIPSLNITFYNSENVLNITSKEFVFQEPYEMPYIPPLRINKYGFKISIQEDFFDYKLILQKLQGLNFEVSLRGYFADKIELSEIKNTEDLLGLSLFQDFPQENSFQNSLGINFCNIQKDGTYTYITFDLQNTGLNRFWKEFIKIILSMNIVEIRSGNITFTKNEFDLFKEYFEIDDEV